MKSRLLNLFVLFGLIGSTFLAPVSMALAATEWTCGSVHTTVVNDALKKVTVVLSHSTDNTEPITLFWGDGMTSTVHAKLPAGNSVYTDTLTHMYAANGPYIITMKVYNPDSSASHDCGDEVVFNGCYGLATALTLSGMDSHKTVTATVSYNAVSPSIDWGDSMTNTLPTGNQVNYEKTHTYAAAGAYTVQLLLNDPLANSVPPGLTTGKCTKLTTNTPSAVSLSSMTAESADAGINWTAIGFALLGLVVLGYVGLLSAIRRR